MKVMCIAECPELAKHDECEYKIQVGEIYTVVDEEISCNERWYELSHHIGVVYLARLFAPLSDIDETELVNNKEEVYA